MRQICKYNKKADIQPVKPGLGCDLKGAIRNGIVRDTSATAFYNQQETTDEVGSRIHDQFDVVEAQGALESMRKKAAEKPDKDN